MSSIFRDGGGADNLQLSSGKGGLEDIGGVYRSLCASRADDHVKLVDKENDVGILSYLLHHAFHTLLKFPPIFGASDHGGDIQGDDSSVPQGVGDGALGNSGRKTLHHRRFPHARLSHETGVVLGAAGEDLDHPLNLPFSADEGVHSPLSRCLGQIPAKGAEHGCAADLQLFLRAVPLLTALRLLSRGGEISHQVAL